MAAKPEQLLLPHQTGLQHSCMDWLQGGAATLLHIHAVPLCGPDTTKSSRRPSHSLAIIQEGACDHGVLHMAVN